MTTVYYLAYGSNLHPRRLSERLAAVTPLGVAALEDTALCFHKRSSDGSGKCTLLAAAGHRLYGALFALEADQLARLDRFEGEGYARRTLDCHVGARHYQAITYEAKPQWLDKTLQPYHWYKQLVVAGAHYHQMPSDYIAALTETPSRPDPNTQRNADCQALLARLANN